MWKKLVLAAVVLLTIFPALTFAAHLPLKQNVWDITILKGPLTVCTGNYINPQGQYASAQCTDLCDVVAQILQILYFVMAVGIWLIIPIMVLYAGIKLILSRGNPSSASEARKAATGAVIGVIIMLCAWVIVNTFVTFFGLTGIGGFNGSGNCLVPQNQPSAGSTSCTAANCGACPNGEACLWNGSACACSGGD